MSLEERVAELERQVAELVAAARAAALPSLEQQHREKVAAEREAGGE